MGRAVPLRGRQWRVQLCPLRVQLCPLRVQSCPLRVQLCPLRVQSCPLRAARGAGPCTACPDGPLKLVLQW